MKHNLLKQTSLFLALTLTALATYAQGPYSPFKGANMILLSTDLADKEAYIAVAQVLTDQSISFSAVSDYLLIRSEGRSFSDSKRIIFEGQLSVNTGLIKLTGWMRPVDEPVQPSTTYASTLQPIAVEYRKNSASLQKAGFLYMEELAKQLQTVLHGVITYRLQPVAKL